MFDVVAEIQKFCCFTLRRQNLNNDNTPLHTIIIIIITGKGKGKGYYCGISVLYTPYRLLFSILW